MHHVGGRHAAVIKYAHQQATCTNCGASCRCLWHRTCPANCQHVSSKQREVQSTVLHLWDMQWAVNTRQATYPGLQWQHHGRMYLRLSTRCCPSHCTPNSPMACISSHSYPILDFNSLGSQVYAACDMQLLSYKRRRNSYMPFRSNSPQESNWS
jgi:hypothetical protein